MCRMALKYLLTVACVLMIFIEQYQAMKCTQISGRLKQIDAGAGLVMGVNANNHIFVRIANSWVQMPGTLKHISVGPAGVWGANRDNNIYKFLGFNWHGVPGSLKQVDAGGNQFVVGVNTLDHVFCMNRAPAAKFKNAASSAPWKHLPGSLKYYSCGPFGCWGVNIFDDIFMKDNVAPTECEDTLAWQHIPGKLSMVEVGNDGSVYGVNSHGDVYRRDHVTRCKPAGTGWTYMRECGKSKHVSYGVGHLWVIKPDDRILDCVV